MLGLHLVGIVCGLWLVLSETNTMFSVVLQL